MTCCLHMEEPGTALEELEELDDGQTAAEKRRPLVSDSYFARKPVRAPVSHRRHLIAGARELETFHSSSLHFPREVVWKS